jgi:DNA helicase-2/ATP-dependent DNA helicase PcrA
LAFRLRRVAILPADPGMPESPLLDGLNPAQRQAVSAPPGPVLVLAGPGSGKTRVLTHRIAYAIHALGAAPEHVLAVTFTNKAAREMLARVQQLLPAQGQPARQAPALGTFHAWAARFLRREADHLEVSRDFAIFDEDDQLVLIRQALKDLGYDPKQVSPSRIQDMISRAKNEMLGPNDMPTPGHIERIAQRVYSEYQLQLRRNNALDFDDLLTCSVQLLRDSEAVRRSTQARHRHILVDEFQDTNSVQYSLLRLLAGSVPDLFAVGDADQSIYRWRGADYRNVRRFQQDFPQAPLVLLEQNYRSTQTILDVATAVIDRAPGRTRKRLFTDRGHGARVTLYEAYDESDEARFVVDTIAELTLKNLASPGECAVMYRTNAQSRSLEEAFLRANLPYRLVGAQRFYGRREVKDVIAYLRLIQNPDDQVSLLRVLNTPPRGLGSKSVTVLLEAASAHSLSPGSMLLQLAETNARPLAGLGAKAGSAMAAFGTTLASWRSQAEAIPATNLIGAVLTDTGFRQYLEDGTPEGEERWTNVVELQNLAAEFADLDLTTFLEYVALVSDQDTLSDQQDAPTLLTLHAAKGLEFGVVILIGLDEGLLPHQRSLEESEALEEERRLFYVGLTRSKDRLFLTRAFRRRFAGTSMISEPSRFLADLPADRIEGDLPYGMTSDQSAYLRQTRWEPYSSSPRAVEPRYDVGMRVSHPTFGEGIVMETHLDRQDEIVTVSFTTVGIKRLDASLAGLEILPET